MLYQIIDGTVSLGGQLILSHIGFELRGNEKIAVAGNNGAGKTTLLRLIAGELELDRDDRRSGPGIMTSRNLTVGMLKQQLFADTEKTVEEILLQSCPQDNLFTRERFAYEQEYDRLFTGFGFEKSQKAKKLSEFSGGEQTKISLIRLLLEKPDILLLDEPTNHLDIETCQWLEEYLRTYDKAIVMVSHDRFFLDRTADVVYEVAGKRLTRYQGNYTHYREEKRKIIAHQKRAYERQQEELLRLDGLVERFKHKPNKASFARSKKKQMERMDRLEKPVEDDVHLFTGAIDPLVLGSKWVLETEHLKLGYEKQLLEITMRIRRGQKIGLLGANGVGKTTFLKTVAGLIPPLGGKWSLGNHVTIGYFDQHSSEIQSELTVLEHFHQLFPSLTEKEVRSILGAYLFSGRDSAKTVSNLSGGEKSRLVLAELLQSRPNFLILDEPTNHMDLQAKETLESAFQAYTGTVLFVSHDRYFLRQVAESVLIFEQQTALYYPFGYEHYLERKEKTKKGESIAAQVKAEDQALIAGMRAVPKAERHRLREISTESAYTDWVLELATEPLESARERFQRLYEETGAILQQWQETEEFWSGTCWNKETEYLDLLAKQNEAWGLWHEECMNWFDTVEKNELPLDKIVEK